MCDVLKGSLQQFFLRVADDLTKLSIDAQPFAVWADVSYAHRGKFEGRSVKLLTFTQSLFERCAALQNFLCVSMALGFFGARRKTVHKRFVLAHGVDSLQQIAGNR